MACKWWFPAPRKSVLVRSGRPPRRTFTERKAAGSRPEKYQRRCGTVWAAAFAACGRRWACDNAPLMTRNQRWLDRLERRFGRFAVPNVTGVLILGQVLLYFISQNRPEILANAILVPKLVLKPDLEVWRLVTFLFVPPQTNLIFAFFFWYLFYIMGTALEQYWGTFRYNVFLLVGFVATIAVSFLTAETRVAESSNLFVQGSVFLAFAHVYPDFVLNLFFVLPIKIKWLALVAWIGYGYGFVTSLARGEWIVVAADLCIGRQLRPLFRQRYDRPVAVGAAAAGVGDAATAGQGEAPAYAASSVGSRI